MSEFREFVQNLVSNTQKELVNADVDAIIGNRYINHKGVDELIREHNEKKAYSSSRYAKAVENISKRVRQGYDYKAIQNDNRWNSRSARSEEAKNKEVLGNNKSCFDLHLGFTENSHPQAKVIDGFRLPKGSYVPKVDLGSKWHDNGKSKSYVNLMRCVSYRFYTNTVILEFKDTDSEFVEHWTRVQSEDRGYSQWLVFRSIPTLKNGSENPYDGFKQLKDFITEQKSVYMNCPTFGSYELEDMLSHIVGEVINLPKFPRYDFSTSCDNMTVFGYFGDIAELESYLSEAKNEYDLSTKKQLIDKKPCFDSTYRKPLMYNHFLNNKIENDKVLFSF